MDRVVLLELFNLFAIAMANFQNNSAAGTNLHRAFAVTRAYSQNNSTVETHLYRIIDYHSIMDYRIRNNKKLIQHVEFHITDFIE